MGKVSTVSELRAKHWLTASDSWGEIGLRDSINNSFSQSHPPLLQMSVLHEGGGPHGHTLLRNAVALAQ